MKKSDESYLVNRIRSLKYALRGALHLIKTEKSIQIQVSIGILATFIGFYFNLNITEWILQCIAIGMVLTAESLNTAIEKICDYIQPEYDKKIGLIKDISAGAVTFSAVFAVIVAILIYWSKVF